MSTFCLSWAGSLSGRSRLWLLGPSCLRERKGPEEFGAEFSCLGLRVGCHWGFDDGVGVIFNGSCVEVLPLGKDALPLYLQTPAFEQISPPLTPASRPSLPDLPPLERRVLGFRFRIWSGSGFRLSQELELRQEPRQLFATTMFIPKSLIPSPAWLRYKAKLPER